MPLNGIPWPDIATAFSSRYKFRLGDSPAPVMSAQAAPWLFLQNGEFANGSSRFAIQQLGVTQEGIFVVTISTEQSDEVVADLVSVLNHSFEFRIEMSKVKLNHISDIVVQFDAALESSLHALGEIQKAVNEHMSAPRGKENKEKEFQLKRLVFGREGYDASDWAGTNAGSFDMVETTEFVIERRVRHSYSENRYFSRAPMQTNSHISALETIERIAMHR